MAPPIKKTPLVLAGDIGGTRTRLGLFTEGKRRPRLRVMETFASREGSRLEDLIERFLEQHPFPVQRACFGVAGPVSRGCCRATNLPWEISEKRIRRRFRWRGVRVMNDLAAAARAVPLLTAGETVRLNRGRAAKDGNVGLICPGTGLGEALLIRHGGGWIPVPSEGGHADFFPASRTEADLWAFLQARFGHVSIERVLSGPGIRNIYSWLRDSGRYREPAWLKRKLEGTDPARMIAETALEKGQPLCRGTLERFAAVLGAVAGNLALTAMTTGGIYIGGGIPPKILPVLTQGKFMEAFTDKGRFRGLMEKIPVRVILNERTALMGAAHGAFHPSS